MPNEVIDKKIGFRLTGNLICSSEMEARLSSDLLYQIEFLPNDTPSATIISLSKGNVQHIPVELPKELKSTSFEKAFVFLVQNDPKLAVSEEGFGRMGNRKLVVAFNHTLSSVNVDLLIQGTHNGMDYRITISPKDIETAQGEIKEYECGEYRNVRVELGELAGLNEKIIKKVLHKLKSSNVQILASHEALSISLGESLKQVITLAQSPPPKATPQPKSFEDVISMGRVEVTLMDLPKKDQEAHYLLNEFEQLFEERKNPSDRYLRKVSNKIHQFYASESFRLFNQFMKTFHEGVLNNPETLKLMNKTLSRFYFLHSKREMNRLKGQSERYKSTFLETADTDCYLNALGIAISLPINDDAKLNYLHLKIVIGIFNVLILHGIENANIFKSALEWINTSSKNFLMLDFLSRYSQQAFVFGEDVLSSDELNLFLDFCDIDDAASLEKPWLLAKKTLENETTGFFARMKNKWKPSDRDWFSQLIAIRRMLLDPSPKMFLNFSQALKTQWQEIQNHIDLHNPYFVFGLTETLSEIMHFPEFDEMDEIVQQEITELMEMIFENNKNEENLPFFIHQKEYRQELIDFYS